MELKLNFAKIVGTPKEGAESWVFVEDGFFLVLQIVGPPDFPVAQKGKEVLAQLSYGYQGLSPKNLAGLAALAEEAKIEAAELSLVLGAQLGKVVYFVCRGGGRVILRRENKFGLILEAEGTASGFVKDGDTFILASPRFNEIVPLSETKKVFDNFSASELAEGLTPLVHRAEDTSGVAALILQFEEVREVWQESPSETTPAPEKPSLIAAGSFFSSFYHLVKNWLSQFKSSSFFLKAPQAEEEKKKRLVFWVAVILLILLGISVVFGLGKRERAKRESRFNQVYELSSHQYQEGKALLGLNNLRASSLLSQAKDSLSTLKKDFKKGTEAKKITELLEKIDQAVSESSQSFKATPELFLELSLIKEGAEGAALAIYQDKLLVLDAKNLALYQVEVRSKSAQILTGGGDLTGGKGIAAAATGVYLLVEKGILAVKDKPQEKKLVIEKDKDWGEIVKLAAYAGNLYLLDTLKGQIWKYTGGEAGFSAKKAYLETEPAASYQASSLAVDGSIWLTRSSQILKFSLGRPEDFLISGLEKPLGENLTVFASDQTKDLYVLDKVNNRLVVLAKNGSYQSQYLWPEESLVTEMVVSETAKKIFLLSGSKVYTLELK